MKQNSTISRYGNIARWIFVSVGFIFVLSGIIVTGLIVAKEIPSSFNWIGLPLLVLGAAGSSTAYFALRAHRLWPLIFLALLYIPWTVFGLIGDIRQGYWPLVVGEGLGLILLGFALIIRLRQLKQEI